MKFYIQDTEFQLDSDLETNSILINSSPRNYLVNFQQGNNFNWLADKICSHSRPLLIIDQQLKQQQLAHLKLDHIPTYQVEAIESNKDINKVLDICDFLTINQANRGSQLFVIGGGILQDLGAFSGAMYKRGIPWTFIPTTLLSQADSCLGGKTAVNFHKTKNVLGLFSAPREVYIDTDFIKTLTKEDILSGIGEIFRLLITGGHSTYNKIAANIDQLANLDLTVITELVKHSLKVKKLIVEHDEFEIDIRRSMNYGHSIGHALEAASDYLIPHGQAVTIGILVENQIAAHRGMLGYDQLLLMKQHGLRLISEKCRQFLSEFQADNLLEFLMNDKKAVGSVLKLATLQNIGHMKFIDLELNSQGQQEVTLAFNEVFK